MYKNLFTIIKYIVIGVLGIAAWWYIIFYALPDWSVYKRLKSQVVSTYCNIKPDSEYCTNIKKRKKDSSEISNYCDKLFPLTVIDGELKPDDYYWKNSKCYCENMNQRGYKIRDGECRNFWDPEFLKDLSKKKSN